MLINCPSSLGLCCTVLCAECVCVYVCVGVGVGAATAGAALMEYLSFLHYFIPLLTFQSQFLYTQTTEINRSCVSPTRPEGFLVCVRVCVCVCASVYFS